MLKVPKRRAASAISSDAPVDQHVRTSERAYYLAEKRGFAPGLEQEDWYAAEGLRGEES